MNSFSLKDFASYPSATFKFIKNNHLIDGPVCGISLKAAGSMRFRWAEQNPLRDKFLLSVHENATPVQLNHTHIVYAVQNQTDTKEKIGDGIVTLNKSLMPVITVADCVPIYFYDEKTGAFGVVHSGWKGTGIIEEALKLAHSEYGSQVEDFSVVIGPHIDECCYIVDENRAKFFAETFTPDCVSLLQEPVKMNWNNGNGKLYRLSLTKANLAVLEKCGVKEENIRVCSDCTCCNNMYGSNRRETSENGRPDAFTVQAAYIYW